jgi:hypothetical protein
MLLLFALYSTLWLNLATLAGFEAGVIPSRAKNDPNYGLNGIIPAQLPEGERLKKLF